MNQTFDLVDAVVLAGGQNRLPLFPGYVPGYKALLPFAGKPSVLYTLEALRSVPQIRRICIVGSQDALLPVLPADLSCEFVPEGRTVAGSFIHGISHFRDSGSILVATADLPLVTPVAIRDFLDGCAAIKPNYPDYLYLSVVPAGEFTGSYQGFAKGFARFRGISVSHGNLALVNPRLLRHTRVTEGLDSLYRVRKNSLRTSFALGWRIGLGYLLGAHLLRLVSLEDMAALVSRKFGVGLIPVSVRHPEIALDVDEPEDYALVKQLLEGGDSIDDSIPAGRQGKAQVHR